MFFASDNGASNEGGHDYAFFGSSGPLRGFKRCLTEGGIRTPLSVTWPGTIPAGVVSGWPTAFWDLGDTILDMVGVPPSQWLHQDGRSIKDVLLSPSGQPPAGAAPASQIYIEFCTAVHPPLEPRTGKGWGFMLRNESLKIVSFFEDQAPRLYNLTEDVYEVHDIAGKHPHIVAEMLAAAKAAHRDSPTFPIKDCVGS